MMTEQEKDKEALQTIEEYMKTGRGWSDSAMQRVIAMAGQVQKAKINLEAYKRNNDLSRYIRDKEKEVDTK